MASSWRKLNSRLIPSVTKMTFLWFQQWGAQILRFISPDYEFWLRFLNCINKTQPIFPKSRTENNCTIESKENFHCTSAHMLILCSSNKFWLEFLNLLQDDYLAWIFQNWTSWNDVTSAVETAVNDERSSLMRRVWIFRTESYATMTYCSLIIMLYWLHRYINQTIGSQRSSFRWGRVPVYSLIPI